MNKIVIVALSAAAFAGCVTKYNEPPEPRPPRTVSVVPAQKGGGKVAPHGARHKDGLKGGRDSRGAKIANWSERPLRVLVNLNDGLPPNKPGAFKRHVQTNVEGVLAQSGYRVVYDKPAEILVYGTLRTKKVNSRGTRVAWNGEADMEITRAPEVNAITGQTMRDVVAKQRFDAKSGDARSDADAYKALADRLTHPLAGFARNGVRKVAGKMQRCTLTIANAWLPYDAPGYPTLFTQRVSAMPGVHSCRIVDTDNAARTMTAEVIFDAEAYPDGFVNRLYQVPDLNIVR